MRMLRLLTRCFRREQAGEAGTLAGGESELGVTDEGSVGVAAQIGHFADRL
jgi:hypothetical protein